MIFRRRKVGAASLNHHKIIKVLYPKQPDSQVTPLGAVHKLSNLGHKGPGPTGQASPSGVDEGEDRGAPVRGATEGRGKPFTGTGVGRLLPARPGAPTTPGKAKR